MQGIIEETVQFVNGLDNKHQYDCHEIEMELTVGRSNTHLTCQNLSFRTPEMDPESAWEPPWGHHNVNNSLTLIDPIKPPISVLSLGFLSAELPRKQDIRSCIRNGASPRVIDTEVKDHLLSHAGKTRLIDQCPVGKYHRDIPA